jgi:hypothetical protein
MCHICGELDQILRVKDRTWRPSFSCYRATEIMQYTTQAHTVCLISSKHTENKHGIMDTCFRLRTRSSLSIIRHISLFLLNTLLICCNVPMHLH